MGCGFCEEALSGLIGGLISLIAFIVFPLMQIFLDSIKIIFEKIGLKE